MSSIASKNLYDLLGNDPEQDPDREPEPPTEPVDKPVQRHGKRNGAAEAPAPAPSGATEGPRRGGRGGARGGHQVDPLNPRGADRAEGREDGVRGERGRGRGRGPREHRGRGERGQEGGGRGYGGRYTRTARDDRSNHTGITSDHEKQAAKGWGGEEGNAEWADEKAGEDIAKAEAKDEPGFTPDTGAGDPAFTNGPGAPGEVISEEAAPEPEPEDKTKSYDQYLAEQAEKRLALGEGNLSVRKPNEGSKQKFPEGTAFARSAEDENFIKGSGGKARREKVQNKKETFALDGQYYAPPDAGDRGGRGRGRGGRGRGEGRGDRGDRAERGDYRGDRGDRAERGDRGGRGGRGRGEYRGNRGGDRGAPRGTFNATDSSSFPALGQS